MQIIKLVDGKPIDCEYFINIYNHNGRSCYSETRHGDKFEAAAEVTDYGFEHDYVETLHRKADGTCEVVDLTDLFTPDADNEYESPHCHPDEL